jgi:hypothetical protein
MKWFSYAMDTTEPPKGFPTRQAAVRDAQSVLDTENRPKRVENGMLMLISKTGKTRYIGRAESFRLCGFAWAHSQMLKKT